MDELEKRWQEVFDRYAELKSEREAQVVRWEWASGQRYDPRPFFFERNGLGRGRRLSVEPPERSGAYLYGFDVQDRVAVARRFTAGMDYSQPALLLALRGLKSVLQWSDQFLWHSDTRTEAVAFTQFEPRMPTAIAVLTQAAGQPVAYRSLEISVGPQIKVRKPQDVWELVNHTGGVLRQDEDYAYQEGRLARVTWRVESLTSPSTVYEQRLSYDQGRLLEVTQVYPDGTVQRPYQRVKRGETLSALAKRVAARLLQAIPHSLAAARLTGRAYCLVLACHDRYAPPGLVVGMEQDRDRLLAHPSADARYFVWVPANPWVEVRDPDFDADYDLFEQQVTRTEGWEVARKMLREVAGRLARRDWTGVFEVTPDFVVFAADYEADDIAESIMASNPPSVVAALRAKGWL